jgi:hypothetical protein
VSAPWSFLDRADPARILVFGGITLLVLNMALGEVFAIFISHVANGEIRLRWNDVMAAVAAGDLEGVRGAFDRIGFLLERRGRIINSHSHAGAFGMLALALALIQPLLDAPARTRRLLAVALVAGGLVQPLFVFVSDYTSAWAHWISDAGAALVIAGLAGTLWLLWRSPAERVDLAREVAGLLASPSSRLLARGGMVLILLGMLFGFWYAWLFLTHHEPRQFELIHAVLAGSGAGYTADAQQLVQIYRSLQSRIALSAAVHSHGIELGMIAIILAFVQRFVLLGEGWKLAWSWVFLIGAFWLPVCIFSAMTWGLLYAAFADLSGALALVALIAMAAGLVRYTGVVDAAPAQGAPP